MMRVESVFSVVSYATTRRSDSATRVQIYGGVAQLGERLICIQDVAGSIPVTSTNNGRVAQQAERMALNHEADCSNQSATAKNKSCTCSALHQD